MDAATDAPRGADFSTPLVLTVPPEGFEPPTSGTGNQHKLSVETCGVSVVVCRVLYTPGQTRRVGCTNRMHHFRAGKEPAVTEVERQRRVHADNEVRDNQREQRTAGTVLAGVLYLLAADPQVRAMYEANDRERFVEGCQNDPSFMQKFGQALLTIRETAVSL